MEGRKEGKEGSTLSSKGDSQRGQRGPLQWPVKKAVNSWQREEEGGPSVKVAWCPGSWHVGLYSLV